MGKEINAILGAQTILIWTFVGQVDYVLLLVPRFEFYITFENVDIFLLK